MQKKSKLYTRNPVEIPLRYLATPKIQERTIYVKIIKWQLSPRFESVGPQYKKLNHLLT